MIGRNTEMIHLLNFLNGGLKACGQLPAIVELKGPFI